jgi:peptidoglycan/LPS O-acetylase OafA/YrhL
MNFIKSFYRITSSGLYIPQVDGIRFIAIISVILYHSNFFYTAKNLPNTHTILNSIFSKGYQGVELFFVLSGFILSLPFAKKFTAGNSNLSLKNYFLRRLTRLEPPYIISTIAFFVLLVFVTKKFTFSYLFPHLLASLTYTSNIIFGETPVINNVLWSLEVEVQFYILAPFICWLIFYKVKNNTARTLLICVLIILAVLLNQYFLFSRVTLIQYLSFFLSGILVTHLYYAPLNLKTDNFLFSSVSAIIIVLIFTNDYINSSIFYKVFFHFIVAILYLIVIRYDALKFFLQNRFVCVIGGACYSIYLLHYQIISFIGNFLMRHKFFGNNLLNEGFAIAIFLIGVLIISMAFFKLIERPCMERNWHKQVLKKFAYKM